MINNHTCKHLNVQNHCKGDCCSVWFGYNQRLQQKWSFGLIVKWLVLQTHLDGWLRDGNYQLCERQQQASNTNNVSLCIMAVNCLCCCAYAILFSAILITSDVIKIQNWNVCASIMQGLMLCMLMNICTSCFCIRC